MNIPPLHEIKTPDGYRGWQWVNGPTFLYEIEDEIDSAEAKLKAMEWAEVEMRVMRLRAEATLRAERVIKNEPIILNIEDARHNLKESDGVIDV